MNLQGLHHITMTTGDARCNVDFYAGVLGLRLVKKTVNFDMPEAYHLYFGDETGSPGSILTWFEFPGAAPGRPGAGQIHAITLGVPSEDALAFWTERVGGARFTDPDGLQLELVVADGDQRAEHPDIPAEYAINRVVGARAYSAYPHMEEKVLTDVLGFAYEGEGTYTLGGFTWGYDLATGNGRQGAGSVHHIAWASADEEHLAWQARIGDAGGFVTDVRDRDYFKSIYFQEPRGVLFEIATLSPGFAIDEDPEHLGEALKLPKQHEHLRERLERTLTPVAT